MPRPWARSGPAQPPIPAFPPRPGRCGRPGRLSAGPGTGPALPAAAEPGGFAPAGTGTAGAAPRSPSPARLCLSAARGNRGVPSREGRREGREAERRSRGSVLLFRDGQGLGRPGQARGPALPPPCPTTPGGLTCKPQSRHPLELRLLEPLPHSAEGLPAGFELAPGLGVPQQVRERPLRAAQHPLGEDSLGDAVPLELGGDPLSYFFGIDFFHLP